MELITILNSCHRVRGFVYHRARFNPDHKSIEVSVRPRKGSAAICSRCHQPAPGYDQLAERRFEFIPRWGFFVFLLYTMRRVDCRRCGVVVVEEVPWGDGKRTLTKAYMLFLARWARRLSWKQTAQAFRTLTAAPGGALILPRGLVFGPDGNLYVANSGVGDVLRYNGTTGAFIDTFVPVNSGGLGGPTFLLFNTPSSTTTPEPFTLGLVGLGLALVAWKRKTVR